MTVANISDHKEVDYVEIVFLESARFYRLPRKSPKFELSLNLLRDAMVDPHVLKVLFSSIESDIIEEVQRPT
jgi:hypothetical protein